MDKCGQAFNTRKLDYTFYSTHHDYYSRIDFILATHNIQLNLWSVNMEAKIYSNHAAVLMNWRTESGSYKYNRWWLDNFLLLDDTVKCQVEAGIEVFFFQEMMGSLVRLRYERHLRHISGGINFNSVL